MQVTLTRRRIRGTLPHFEYRVLIPFDAISVERQNLIHIRSDYGVKPGPWARTRDVIAPMAHLRMAPGLTRYDRARSIDQLAKRIDTLLVRHFFPEMTAAVLPIVFLAETDPDDGFIYTDIVELTGRFEQFASRGPALSMADLDLNRPDQARAA